MTEQEIEELARKALGMPSDPVTFREAVERELPDERPSARGFGWLTAGMAAAIVAALLIASPDRRVTRDPGTPAEPAPPKVAVRQPAEPQLIEVHLALARPAPAQATHRARIIVEGDMIGIEFTKEGE